MALFPGVVNALSLVARCCDARHSVRRARGYLMRPKPRSYANQPRRQSPEMICEHWRPSANLPFSQLCPAAASEQNLCDARGAHLSIAQYVASRLSRVSTASAAIYGRSGRGNGPRARCGRAARTLFPWRLLANRTTQANENRTRTLLEHSGFAPAACRVSRPRGCHPHGGSNPSARLRGHRFERGASVIRR